MYHNRRARTQRFKNAKPKSLKQRALLTQRISLGRSRLFHCTNRHIPPATPPFLFTLQQNDTHPSYNPSRLPAFLGALHTSSPTLATLDRAVEWVKCGACALLASPSSRCTPSLPPTFSGGRCTIAVAHPPECKSILRALPSGERSGKEMMGELE